MNATETLREVTPRTDRRLKGEACPRCGETLGGLSPVDAAALGGVGIRRCRRCGTRSTSTSPSRLMFSCESCGLPFLTEDLLPRAEQVCPGCREGQPPAGLPDPLVVRATENEVRSALQRRWRFVASPPLGAYLDRMTRQVARRVEGAPPSSRVVLVDGSALETLALPSGTLLMTVGTLSFLEDEAELAFLLGHELAHGASGDAAVRLVRLGFDAVARDREAVTPAAWAEAAMDLVRLGYGRKRERDADARALEALLALDYDPESAFRYLRRLHAALEAGEPSVAEIAVSHPPPLDRIRRMERALWGKVQDGKSLRVNREVFRRAASRDTLSGKLSPFDLSASEPTSPAAIGMEEVRPRRRGRFLVAATILAALAAVAVMGGLLLLR